MSRPSETVQEKRRPLTTIRDVPKYHWVGLLGACLVGLLVASIHWLGLVVGGALVGLLASDTKRAVLAGIGFGTLTIVVWLSLLWLSGTAGQTLSMGEFALIPLTAALGLSVLGSLVRGVI